MCYLVERIHTCDLSTAPPSAVSLFSCPPRPPPTVFPVIWAVGLGAELDSVTTEGMNVLCLSYSIIPDGGLWAPLWPVPSLALYGEDLSTVKISQVPRLLTMRSTEVLGTHGTSLFPKGLTASDVNLMEYLRWDQLLHHGLYNGDSLIPSTCMSGILLKEIFLLFSPFLPFFFLFCSATYKSFLMLKLS